ncbi:MAG: hypothetical protein AAGA48_12510 [Myxococcota bacterium]
MWVGLIAAAFAGELYINGTRVDPASVAGVELEKVTVTFDEQGNTRIDAPGYKIKVVDRPKSERTASAPTAVPQGTYWLVTQDLRSQGHKVVVRINGTVVAMLRSGEEPVIEDIAQYLQPGANRIVVSSESVDPAGGSFYVFIGNGVDDDGTVRIDKPVVEYGLGTANRGSYEKSYSLQVP